MSSLKRFQYEFFAMFANEYRCGFAGGQKNLYPRLWLCLRPVWIEGLVESEEFTPVE